MERAEQAKVETEQRLAWLHGGGPLLPLYLAPMAGYTDKCFRECCKAQGADVMVTEFVMANKFLDARGEETAWKTVDFTPTQRPMGVQIFGGEPDKMAEAARRIAERLQPDFIDINYGCPAPKVVNNCAGSSLLRNPCLLGSVAAAVVKAVGARVAVTAKIRIGWDADSINAVDIARRLEGEGVEAIAVHGRTKAQGYRGEADWGVIEHVARAVGVPVIGNGSIRTAADIRRIQNETAVRGLMIGRAALGYPWIFRELKHAMATGAQLPPPQLSERWATLLAYCEALLAHGNGESGPWSAINWMRPQLQAFTKDMPAARELRGKFAQIADVASLRALAQWHLEAHAAAEQIEVGAQQ